MSRYADVFTKISNSSGIKISSKEVSKGDIFVCLKGQNSDGHNYIDQAIKNGAVFCIVSNSYLADNKANEQYLIRADTDDVLEFITKLSKEKINILKFNGVKVIAITGSVGKTTTTSFTCYLLSLCGLRVFKTIKNYNNNIGLPVTILSSPFDLDFLVLELGMDKAGEILYLSQIARPNYSVITQIAETHFENFSTIEEIAMAKAEIMDFTEEAVFLNEQSKCFDVLVRKAKSLNLKQIITKPQDVTSFNAEGEGSTFLSCGIQFAIPRLVSKQWASCVAIPLNIILHIGKHYIQALSKSKIDLSNAEIKGRGDVAQITINSKNIYLINESYNSSPESLKNAIECLKQYKGRKLAIVGDMLELGKISKQRHIDLKDYLKGIDAVLVGTIIQGLHAVLDKSLYFAKSEDLIGNIKNINLEDYDVVLVKASNGVGLWKVAEYLLKTYGKGSN